MRENLKTTSIKNSQNEFKRGWRIIVLSFIGMASTAAVMVNYGFGVMVVPLEKSFAWSRSEILVAPTFLTLGGVVSSILAGWLNKKYGVRVVTLVSLPILAVAFFVMSNMDRLGKSIWILYILFFMITISGVGALQVTWTQLVNLWFNIKRGLALAIILSATGVTGVIIPPLLSNIIYYFSWREAFIFLALIPLTITFPLSIMWLSPIPARAKLESLKNAEDNDNNAWLTGMAFSTGIRSLRYWTISIALVLVCIAIMVVIYNAVPILQDMGYTAIEAGQIFSAFGASLFLGRLVVGYLIDRIWAPRVAFVTLFLPAVGCFLLTSDISNMWFTIGAIMLTGIGAGAEYDIAAFLIARYFGMLEYSRFFGLHMALVHLGISLSPLLAAYCYGLTGSYNLVLYVSTTLFLMGSGMMLTLGRYPNFETEVRKSIN